MKSVALAIAGALALTRSLAGEVEDAYDHVWDAFHRECGSEHRLHDLHARALCMEDVFARWGQPHGPEEVRAREDFRSVITDIEVMHTVKDGDWRADENLFSERFRLKEDSRINEVASEQTARRIQAAEKAQELDSTKFWDEYNKCIQRMAKQTAGLDPWTVDAYNHLCMDNTDAWRYVRRSR